MMGSARRGRSAAAAAAKSGLLGKFIKPIGIAILAGLAAIGRRRKTQA